MPKDAGRQLALQKSMPVDCVVRAADAVRSAALADLSTSIEEDTIV
jgi:hypothetical protein